MKLNYDIEAPKFKPRKKGKLISIIENFIDSGKRIAVVDGLESDYESAGSAQASFAISVKRSCLPVRVFRASGVLYIERTDLDV